ncbi:MAG TPA: membrane protein insertion efficiency factor YidD [Alphaproteobacteria bacterium]|jgi:putative membrane protein insertion efficiency factor
MRPGVLAARVAIRLYQYVLSPLIGPTCRFAPSCSEYAIEAITRFGAARGSWLALRRLLRCHPWGGSGYDPVPDRPGTVCPDEAAGRPFAR